MFNNKRSLKTPNNENEKNLSLFTSFNQYACSLKSSSNASSNILLQNTWDRHIKVFDENSIVQAVDTMLENNTKNNSKTWKSSLSNFMKPEILFEEAIPTCSKCTYNSTKNIYFKEFQINSCRCDTKIFNNEQILKGRNVVDDYKSKPIYLKTLSSEDSSGETSSFDEQKSALKPKFGRSKNVIKNIPAPVTKSIPKEMESDIEILDEEKAHSSNVAKITFKTAREQFLASNPAAKRTLGASRKAQGKFVSPMIPSDKQEIITPAATDDRLKHVDPKMVELIESEIIDKGTPIGWEDIAGLHMAKSVIQEAVVWPLLRPDIFTGLRRPPKGILLFGPPGTGKTLIGKCVAAQCNATFFSISASSLTSKWIGDGEKMVRALFAVARCYQPAVVFIDEIDSLLTQRSDSEHESTRRIKTEFLVQLDGAATGDEDRLLIIGATNRPQELDEAARRRLVKRLYIPLPDIDARKQIITNLLENENNLLGDNDIEEISRLTEGFSGADMKSLCSEAAMGPIRSVPLSQIVSIQRDNVRPVNVQDFKNALERVRPSVSQDDLGQYVKWNKTYGQGF